MVRITRNHIRVQPEERVARIEQDMADAEAEFLRKVRAYQEFKQERLPRLAKQRDAITADVAALMRILEAGKDKPLLANLPLLEMKAQLLYAQNPQIEEELIKREVKHQRHRVFPIAPKD